MLRVIDLENKMWAFKTNSQIQQSPVVFIFPPECKVVGKGMKLVTKVDRGLKIMINIFKLLSSLI